MAYKIIRDKLNMHQTCREITAILDAASDLATLQANETGLAPGSLAIIADAGLKSYVLNASGEWKSVDDDGSSGGGGGNPNTVEVIEGTVAAPFGDNMTDAEFQQLCVDVLEGAATVGTSMTGSPEIYGTTFTYGGAYALAFSHVAGTNASGVYEVTEPTASLLVRGPNTTIRAVIYNTQADGFVDIPDQTPLTFRIIRHPLPESTTGGNA